MNSRGPLIVGAIMLLLPVLYFGSYLALVDPAGHAVIPEIKLGDRWMPGLGQWVHYRVAPAQAERIFWPLEQIDRKVRPRAWDADLDFRF